jgi:hypothetical protein
MNRRVSPVALALLTLAILEIERVILVLGSGASAWASTASALPLIALATLWLAGEDSGAEPSKATKHLLAVLPVIAAAHTLWTRHVLDWEPTRLWGLPALATLILLAGLVSLGRFPGLTLVALVILGLLLRHIQFRLYPVDESRGDMVPLARDAIDGLVRGVAPYRTYHFPWSVPLTSLPLAWLVHAPLRLARVDMRWTNTACSIAVLAALVYAQQTPRPLTWITGLWGTWFLSERVLIFETLTIAPAHWAALAWGAAAILRRNRGTPFVIGAAIATTPLAALLVPFLFRGVYPSGDSPRATVHEDAVALAIALATMVALVLPWFAWTPRAFIEGTLFWFGDITRFPTQKWLEARSWARLPGFSAAFFTMGIERLLQPLQIGSTIGVLWIAYRRRVPAPAALVSTHLVFMVFNPVVWLYLYEPAYVYAMVATLGIGLQGSRTSMTSPGLSRT